MGDDDPFAIPAFLVRDDNNESEITRMATTQTEEAKSRPAKSAAKADKPAPKATVKAADKPKAKAAAKPAAKAKAPAKPAKAAKAPKADAAKKDKWGLREGSAKSKAVAMYAAKGGATLEEVKAEVGSVQLNVLNDLEEAGHTVTRTKEQREGQRPVTRYALKAKKD